MDNMGYNIPNILYRGEYLSAERLVDQARQCVNECDYPGAIRITNILKDAAAEFNNKELLDETREIGEACHLKIGYERVEISLLPGDTRPQGSTSTMEMLAEESIVPKQTKNPRLFKINDDFKKKMLHFIYLTWRNNWYGLRAQGRKLAVSDVYYWFGVLLDYEFGNKSGKLTELYERGTDKDLHSLAQEVYDFASELEKMSDEAKKNRGK